MTFSDKIDEWIKEAELRPASALMILKLVANRLRELSERNEELLAENIALQDGTRVEEYQKRITYLEHQLEMLKRRAGDLPVDGTGSAATAEAPNLLVYNADGRILRLPLAADVAPGQVTGELTVNGEFPRLLALPAQEEVLLLFSSGRINTLPVEQIPVAQAGGPWAWESAPLPDEPHASELLAGLMPLSRLPLADYFLQTSRRGCIKKTLTSIAQSVLGNRYLGRGAIQKTDQPFGVSLCQKKDRYALVTYEGRLLGLDVDDLSYAAEERIRLSATDFVVAAFPLAADQLLVCVTQNGKVVQREAGFLETPKSAGSRGQTLIPPSRLEQGTRFIGAVAAREADQLVALEAGGQLSFHSVKSAADSGSIPAKAALLSIGLLSAS